MKPIKMLRIAIFVTPKQNKHYKELGERIGCSKSEAIRNVLDSRIEQGV